MPLILTVDKVALHTSGPTIYRKKNDCIHHKCLQPCRCCFISHVYETTPSALTSRRSRDLMNAFDFNKKKASGDICMASHTERPNEGSNERVTTRPCKKALCCVSVPSSITALVFMLMLIQPGSLRVPIN